MRLPDVGDMQSVEDQPYRQVRAEYRADEPLADGKR
jgi:hypothetical protein